MKIIWLESCSGDVSDLPGHRKEIVPVISGDQAAAFALQPHCAAVIVDVQDSSDARRAFELLEELRGKCPVWIHQRSATVDSALSFIKAGAAQVVTGPEDLEQAMNSVPDSASPGAQSGNTQSGNALVGGSRATQAVSASIGLVASRRCNVLIEGETGTGKEVVAREIHHAGNRARGPWVAVNCGAIPESLLEAELFGHVRGAFTGAVQSRAGKFEMANHGTIFLDEIGDMPFSVQAKLLRVLQEKEVERLGANERIRLDVRVIAATNVNLSEKVEQGLFRQDLYYRLNVFRIALSPLRERPADIPALAQHFIARICASEGARPKALDASALDRLLEHTWPGNARELENVMETALILCGPRSSIFASDIRIDSAVSKIAAQHAVQNAGQSTSPSRALLPSGGLDYQQVLETFEHDLLTQALARTRGNKTAAADLLRLKRTTLSARMRVLESRMPRLVA
jgi:two-component system, NtrC family, response regulator AtoC